MNSNFFDANVLLLYKNFINSECGFELILYDFKKRLNCLNIQLDEIAMMNIIFRSNMMKNFNKRLTAKFKLTEYNNLEQSLSNLIDSNEELLKKQPYSIFTVGEVDIYSDKTLFTAVCHCYINYALYILLSLFNTSRYKNLIPNRLPKSLAKKELKSTYPDKILSIKSIINSFLQFFAKLPKKQKIYFYDNQNFIEVFIYYNIFNSVIYKRVSRTQVFRYFNQRILIQTLIMILNTNRDNYNFTNYISSVLSMLLVKSYSSLLNIVNVFDMSGMDFKLCKKLISKLIISKPKDMDKLYYYSKITSQCLHIITNLKNSQHPKDAVKGLLEYFVELLLEVCVNFKDDVDFEMILFNNMFKGLFAKFGYDINRKEHQIYNKEFDINNGLVKPTYINYLQFISEHFGVIIKSSFPNVFGKLISNYKLLQCPFEMIFVLTDQNSFYYENLKSTNHIALRNIIYMLMENIDNYTLAKFIFKFYTKRLFENATSHCSTYYKISTGLNDDIIVNKTKISYKEYIDYITSLEFSQRIINSLENCVKNVFLYNKDILSCFLRIVCLKEESLFCGHILPDIDSYREMLCTESLLYNQDDIDEVVFKVSKLNQVYLLVTNKLLQSLFSTLANDDTIMILSGSEDLFKFIIILLKNIDFDNSDLNKDLIETCLHCLSVVVIKITSGDNLNINILKHIYEIIPLLKKIEKGYEIITDILNKVNLYKEETTVTYIMNEKNIKLNELFKSLEAKGSQFEQAFALYKINKYIEPIDKNILQLHETQLYYNILISYLKNVDSYLWSISMKVLVKLIVLALQVRDSVEFIFSLFKETIFNNINMKTEDSDTIALQNQLVLKILELLEKVIKRQKAGCVKMYNNIMSLILDIFDEYFYKLNPAIISGCLSVISSLTNYSGLEMSSYLSTLILTCLNHLNNFSSNAEVRRASALLMFRILQNCDFYHYKEYARRIYNTIKLNMESLNNDRVVQFHVNKTMRLIKECVSEFFNIDFN
jgi:hypothetical protein